jgi:serine phosphatase RsbU (regulator of sigma subunit)
MMSQARICLRSLAQAYADVGTIFTLANRVFSGALPEDYYATLTLARLDLNTRFLTYASAGHPTSYVFDTLGNVKWRLESTDCPLGLLPHSMYGTSSPLRLEPGETVLMVTNGILKVRGADGSSLGPQRLLDTVAANCRLPAAGIVEAIGRLAAGHLQNRPPDDDLTTVVIKAR